MKELSIEEKAKRYDEAISIAREYDFSLTGVCAGDVIEDVFPELKESENERIRKVLKEYFINSFQINGVAAICGVHIKDIIAWLEKQGEKKSYASETMNEKGDFDNGFTRMMEKEQKPAWSEEDETKLTTAQTFIRNTALIGNDGIKNATIDWLKSLKDRVQPQAREWSEEDKNHVKSILSTIECCKAQFPNAQAVVEAYNADIEWLKSIRPHWKPSEEMLEALYRAIPENVMEISEDEMLLDKLYQGLKYGRVLSKN